MAFELRRFFRGIHERSIWQILVGYAAGSWVVLGASGTAMDVIGLPDWVPSFVFVICLMGLPMVLATALIQRTGSKAESNRVMSDTRGLRRWLTWRHVTIAFGIAFGLLATGTSGYMGMRVLGIGPVGTLLAQGTIERRDKVLIADFDNPSQDSLIAIAVTEALRADLSESGVVETMDRAYVSSVLERMALPIDQPVTERIALEVAVREGIKAVVSGSVGSLGNGFSLAARLIVADTGEEILSIRETADGPNSIITAVDRLSKRMRERIGEPLRSIRSGQSLEQVTTSSLEALKHYSRAESAAGSQEFETAARYLGLALEEDSLFAMAWRKLGVVLQGLDESPDSASHAYQRALELSDRLTERERLITRASHTNFGEGSDSAAIPLWNDLLDLYPNDHTGLHNLMRAYVVTRQTSNAAEIAARLFDAGERRISTLRLISNAFLRVGDAERGLQVLERTLEISPSDSMATTMLLPALAGSFRYREAEEISQVLTEDLPRGARGHRQRSQLMLAQGRIEEGMGYFSEFVFPDDSLTISALSAYWGIQASLFLLEDGPATLEAFWDWFQIVSDASGGYSLDQITNPEIPYWLARAGDPETASQALRQPTPDTPGNVKSSMRLASGAIAEAKGEYPRAIDLFIEAEALADSAGFSCGESLHQDRIRVHEKLGNADSVIVLYERFLTPHTYRFNCGVDWRVLWRAYLSLGQHYEARGDTANAIEHYNRFVDLWSDADPELQPRVEAARAALARLQGGLN